MNRRGFFAAALGALVIPFVPRVKAVADPVTWHTQAIQRFNEAIALDYVVPYRIVDAQGNIVEEG